MPTSPAQLILTITPDGQMLVSARTADGTQSPPRGISVGQDNRLGLFVADMQAIAGNSSRRSNPRHRAHGRRRPSDRRRSSTRRRRPATVSCCRNVEQRRQASMQHRPRHTGSARDHGLNVGNGEDQQRDLCASGSRLHHSNARRDHPDRPSNSDTPAAMMPLLASFIGLSNADISACAASSGVVQPSASG